MPALLTRMSISAHRRLGARDQLVHRLAVGEVADEDVDPLAEFGGERVERFAPGAGDRDGRALGVERAGDGAADRSRSHR